MFDERIIVFDIESEVVGEKPDGKQDIPKWVGFKDSLTQKHKMLHFIKDRKEINDIFTRFTYFAGHNIIRGGEKGFPRDGYDVPMLRRYGIDFRNKVLIDTLGIVENRAKSMLYIDIPHGKRGLGALCERFNLDHQKGDIDYDIFKKDEWTDDEIEEIRKYLYGDLDSNMDLLKMFYDLFYGFKDFMNKNDQKYMCWLKNKPGSTTYKIICNITGMSEEYEDNIEDEGDIRYEGAFVSQPYADFVKG